MQRAAERDVDHLRAAADAQYRHTAQDRPADQRDLPRIALLIGRYWLVGLKMGLRTATGRVLVPAAGDDQAVQPVEYPAGGVGGLRRKQHSGPAGEVDAVGVDGGQKRRV